jgi:DNA-binding transcriptional LysR family regulator
VKALADLQLFVATVEAGSLSAAARRLGLTPAGASAAIKRLEAELGVPLLLRTTRKQRLSPQGELFLTHARQALDTLQAAQSSLQRRQEAIQGRLRVSVPSDLGRHVLQPWLDDFLLMHPGLSLQLHVSDRLADPYSQPVDVLVRYGAPPDSSLVALPLAPANRRLMVASPEYVRRRGAPESPLALLEHDTLCYMLGEQAHDRWRFESPQGQPIEVAVEARRLADDGEVVRRWAVQGQGIAYKSELDVAHDLRAGRLVPLCADWRGELGPLNLMCADRRQLSPAVRLLHAFLGERLAAHAAWSSNHPSSKLFSEDA